MLLPVLYIVPRRPAMLKKRQVGWGGRLAESGYAVSFGKEVVDSGQRK